MWSDTHECLGGLQDTIGFCVMLDGISTVDKVIARCALVVIRDQREKFDECTAEDEHYRPRYPSLILSNLSMLLGNRKWLMWSLLCQTPG